MTQVAAPLEGVREIRLGGVRKFIAERMRESLAGTAQLSFHAEADITRLLELRAGWKAALIGVGIEDCLVAVLARALALQPDCNGTANADSVTLHDAVHIAVAIAAPDGLKTPVLRDVATKPLAQIARERCDLVDRARDKKLQVSEMKGATATLSNLGASRVRFFTPILNSGQLLLLGIGTAEIRPAFDATGAVAARTFLGLSLTVDHRIIDGEPAARLLTSICEQLESFGDSP